MDGFDMDRHVRDHYSHRPLPSSGGGGGSGRAGSIVMVVLLALAILFFVKVPDAFTVVFNFIVLILMAIVYIIGMILFGIAIPFIALFGIIKHLCGF